jgi:phage terminase large subunit
MATGLTVNIPKEKFLPVYWHLLDDTEFFDIDFLYGGRDSGKSRHVAMRLIVDCMRSGYFKCLLIRKVLNTVRDSQFSLIKSIIEEWKLTPYFSFNETRLEIVCKLNGNAFYGRGLDDVGRIKSFANPSHCWIEEGNQIDGNDFVVILTSLRSEQRVKTWFTFNPECEVNYTDFWLYQEWFSHSMSLSWTWDKQITVNIGGVDVEAEFKIRATHSTYKDNPYCSAQRRALYESYKGSKNNAYWYQTYTLGLWGYRRTGGEFWKCFDETKHTKDLPPLNKDIVLWVVADNNVNPYVAIALWQINTATKKIDQVGEIPCEHPKNTAAKAGKEAVAYLNKIGYNLPVYIGGDPSANKRSTEDDEGRSFFDKFKSAIKDGGFQIVDRVGRSAPSVAQSGFFVNEIYESNYDGWEIRISTSCRKSIEDYNMAKEAADGTILKKNVTDKDSKVSFQRYGHFSDNKRYFITTVLAAEYLKYQSRGKRVGSIAVPRM